VKMKKILLLLPVVSWLCVCNPGAIAQGGPGDVLRAPDGTIAVIVDGRRRHVPDPPTVERLGLRPDEIHNVPMEVFRSFPLGRPLPHLDRDVLRAPDGRIDVINHFHRRHVPDPETLEHLGLRKDEVLDVSWEVFRGFPEGRPLPHIDRRALRAPSGEIDLIEHFHRRPIPDPETMRHMEIRPEEVQEVSMEVFRSIPQGEPIPAWHR
jgi:hypothetical protein